MGRFTPVWQMWKLRTRQRLVQGLPQAGLGPKPVPLDHLTLSHKHSRVQAAHPSDTLRAARPLPRCPVSILAVSRHRGKKPRWRSVVFVHEGDSKYSETAHCLAPSAEMSSHTASDQSEDSQGGQGVPTCLPPPVPAAPPWPGACQGSGPVGWASARPALSPSLRQGSERSLAASHEWDLI